MTQIDVFLHGDKIKLCPKLGKPQFCTVVRLNCDQNVV